MIPISAGYLTSQHPSRVAWIFLALLLIIFFLLIWPQSFSKHFTIDEYNYAHAAWLVAKGQVPYRDFFAIHTPLSFYVFSLPTLLLDSPESILNALRGVSLCIVFATCCGLYLLTSSYGRLASVTPIVLFLACSPINTLGTEIRPDLLAVCLLTFSLLLMVTAEKEKLWHGLLAGTIFGLAVLSSEKILFYGLGSLFVISCVAWLRRNTWSRAFFLGAFVVAAVFICFLLVTGATQGFWKSSIGFIWQHEQSQYGFHWSNYFLPFVKENRFLCALALLGGVRLIFELVNREASLKEVHILAGALSSLLFFLSISIPYPYNLQPLCLFAALLSAKALQPTYRESINIVLLLLGCASLTFASLSYAHPTHESAALRSKQIAMLETVEELVGKETCVYDNSGQAITRPHAYYYFFNSRLMRNTWGKKLNKEVPEAIHKNECVVMLNDLRMSTLPKKLQAFLSSNYQRYKDDIFLWGKKFSSGVQQQEFTVIKNGQYFLITEAGEVPSGVRIDEQEIQTGLIELSKGIHFISSDGSNPQKFYLLWFPNNQQLWEPSPEDSTLSVMF